MGAVWLLLVRLKMSRELASRGAEDLREVERFDMAEEAKLLLLATRFSLSSAALAPLARTWRAVMSCL